MAWQKWAALTSWYYHPPCHHPDLWLHVCKNPFVHADACNAPSLSSRSIPPSPWSCRCCPDVSAVSLSKWNRNNSMRKVDWSRTLRTLRENEQARNKYGRRRWRLDRGPHGFASHRIRQQLISMLDSHRADPRRVQEISWHGDSVCMALTRACMHGWEALATYVRSLSVTKCTADVCFLHDCSSWFWIERCTVCPEWRAS